MAAAHARLASNAIRCRRCWRSAAATHEELAELLGVNLRTVERDVEALAGRGVTLFTRRYRIYVS